MSAAQLTLPQKRALDLALAHWEKQGVWPDRRHVIASLLAEGLDYKLALSESLWPLVRTGDGRRIELTVFGAAVAEGGEQCVRYFIPLVKRAIERFLQNPRGKPCLTNAHLGEVAESEPAENLQRMNEL